MLRTIRRDADGHITEERNTDPVTLQQRRIIWPEPKVPAPKPPSPLWARIKERML